MFRKWVAGVCLVVGATVFWHWQSLAIDKPGPTFGQAQIVLNQEAAPPASLTVAGFALVANKTGPQVALMQPPTAVTASLRQDEQVRITIPVRGLQTGKVSVSAEVSLADEGEAQVVLTLDQATLRRAVKGGQRVQLEVTSAAQGGGNTITLECQARFGAPTVQLRHLRLSQGQQTAIVQVNPLRQDPAHCPPAVLPPMRQGIEQALIEWDWRMQDGIGTERQPRTYQAAIAQTLQRGDALLGDLQASKANLGDLAKQWQQLRDRFAAMAKADEATWEDLWKQVHNLRRRLAFRNPLANTGPVVFAKQVPGSFSHQLTEYLGRFARPGGGIFVLDNPGQSMRVRQLAGGQLPEGSFSHPEVSYDGKRILFAFCKVAKTTKAWNDHADHFYHLYEMAEDGSGLQQLTQGAFNDFAPRYLPNGQIIFISTRRGGWHRCGGAPGQGCENFTLALANGDGSQPRTISYHETQEWDPVVLHDGQVLFTRWDYVDRHAVFYQQLFVARPDGTAPASFYGNNTFNPVGIWEAKPVPGSKRVMATAGAHHAMTAGSIILVDGDKAVDGPAALTRLTPDALFPESEWRIPPHWHNPVGVDRSLTVPVEAQRWPGHCYRSPHPLSENYFLASYSFDSLLGEPQANLANMFGLYLMDRFGNKELLYRDLNICSVWATPLKARPRPPVANSIVENHDKKEGKFFVQNIYEAEPPLPPGSIKKLRVLQVLPKSTPGANWPRVGIANASPGKQVLGTVPVEPDGSAYFTAPAGIPLAFQALDENGMAVQIMRSVTYLQPGEVRSCTGCHERRTTAAPPSGFAQALQKAPASIEPGPDGSRPLSYPILVQPVLDKHCVRCHSKDKPEGKVILSGEAQGSFTASYNALAPRVSYADWGGRGGDFRLYNSEPISKPGHFGALGSRLTKYFQPGHHQVNLNRDELDRIITWMDANAMFYGTFSHADQAKQRLGYRIAGPDHQ